MAPTGGGVDMTYLPWSLQATLSGSEHYITTHPGVYHSYIQVLYGVQYVSSGGALIAI